MKILKWAAAALAIASLACAIEISKNANRIRAVRSWWQSHGSDDALEASDNNSTEPIGRKEED